MSRRSRVGRQEWDLLGRACAEVQYSSRSCDGESSAAFAPSSGCTLKLEYAGRMPPLSLATTIRLRFCPYPVRAVLRVGIFLPNLASNSLSSCSYFHRQKKSKRNSEDGHPGVGAFSVVPPDGAALDDLLVSEDEDTDDEEVVRPQPTADAFVHVPTAESQLPTVEGKPVDDENGKRQNLVLGALPLAAGVGMGATEAGTGVLSGGGGSAVAAGATSATTTTTAAVPAASTAVPTGAAAGTVSASAAIPMTTKIIAVAFIASAATVATVTPIALNNREDSSSASDVPSDVPSNIPSFAPSPATRPLLDLCDPPLQPTPRTPFTSSEELQFAVSEYLEGFPVLERGNCINEWYAYCDAMFTVMHCTW